MYRSHHFDQHIVGSRAEDEDSQRNQKSGRISQQVRSGGLGWEEGRESWY